jgi:hypothetical protein
MGSLTFQLIEDFPETSYQDVLLKYYPRSFYRGICEDKGIAEEFIKTIALFNTDRSAQILSAILSRKPFMPCPTDISSLKSQLIRSIWNNPCPAYSKLKEQTRGDMEELKKSVLEIYIPGDTVNHFKDTSSEPINWWLNSPQN